MTVVHSGDLVYLDSFAGLIPAKLLAVSPYRQYGRCRVTANRRAYSRGEVVTFRLSGIVPRNHVYTRSGQCRIRGEWTFA